MMLLFLIRHFKFNRNRRIMKTSIKGGYHMKLFVANVEAFVPNQPVLFEQESVRIYLAFKDSKIYAIADKCPHLGTSLMKGTYEDGVVTCKSHGAKIDISSGDIIEKAHLGFVKMPTKIAKTYQVSIEDNKVYVEI